MILKVRNGEREAILDTEDDDWIDQDYINFLELLGLEYEVVVDERD